MELLWQDGQVVVKSQRSPRKPHDHSLDLIPSAAAAVRVGSPSPVGDPLLQHYHQLQQQEDADTTNNNLFIQEDEMSSWLLSDFCSDLLLPSAPAVTPSVPSCPLPSLPPPKRLDSFGHFSRPNPLTDEATVVDSSDTPIATRASEDTTRVGAQFASPVVRFASSRDQAGTSSSSASSASADPIPSMKTEDVGCPPKAEEDGAPEERKRKAMDCDWSNDGEDVEPVLNDDKRVSRGSSSTKRPRAAEVHNQSERRRRDRINEKMRALRELIPHCNKADKASMLDEAIEYLKSLQMQVQMMSMGCGMMPMMFPRMQQYIPHTGMGMNRPTIPFPNVFNSSTLPTTAAGAHMGPGFHFPAFQMSPHIPAPDPSRVLLQSSQSNATLSSSSLQNSNLPRMPGFMDPYQNFFGLPHMHFHFQQSQASASSSSKPTTSKAGETSQKESPD